MNKKKDSTNEKKSKIANLNPTILVNILKINYLNTIIKRQRLSNWLLKKGQLHAVQNNTFKKYGPKNIKNTRMAKAIPCKSKYKKSGVTDKEDVETITDIGIILLVSLDEGLEEIFMIKGLTHQDETITLKMFAPSNRGS